jgi:hypothetical protein
MFKEKMDAGTVKIVVSGPDQRLQIFNAATGRNYESWEEVTKEVNLKYDKEAAEEEIRNMFGENPSEAEKKEVLRLKERYEDLFLDRQFLFKQEYERAINAVPLKTKEVRKFKDLPIAAMQLNDPLSEREVLV